MVLVRLTSMALGRHAYFIFFIVTICLEMNRRFKMRLETCGKVAAAVGCVPSCDGDGHDPIFFMVKSLSFLLTKGEQSRVE